MICAFTKRFISRHLDDGKPFPSRIKNHIHHCPECLHFFQVSAELTVAVHPEENRQNTSSDFRALEKRIIAELHSIPARQRHENKRRSLIPALAASAALIASISLILFTFMPNKTESLPADSSESPPTLSFHRAVMMMEAPAQKELNSLKNNLAQTTRFLVSKIRLNIQAD